MKSTVKSAKTLQVEYKDSFRLTKTLVKGILDIGIGLSRQMPTIQ